MANVAYRDSNTGASSTVTPPAGATTGDLILVATVVNGATTVPGTFTRLGTDVDISSGYFVGFGYRIRQVGDTTYSGWTGTIATICDVYYNVHQADSLVASSVTGYSGDANIPIPSLTASAVAGDAAAYLVTGISSSTYTAPGSYQERVDTGNSQTCGDRIGLTESQSTSGTLVSSFGGDVSAILHVIIRSTNGTTITPGTIHPTITL